MTLLPETLKSELEEELCLIKSDLCRCCHAEGSFNHINFKFFSDILKESMNINLSPIDGILMNATSKICDKCIQKVLDVDTFRAQVLACEQRFQELCTKNLIKVGPLLAEVKIEDVKAVETRLKSENGGDWPSDDALHCNNSKDEEPLEEKPTEEELRTTMATSAKAKCVKARKARAKPPEARNKARDPNINIDINKIEPICYEDDSGNSNSNLLTERENTKPKIMKSTQVKKESKKKLSKKGNKSRKKVKKVEKQEEESGNTKKLKPIEKIILTRAQLGVHYAASQEPKGYTCLLCEGVYGVHQVVKAHVEWKHMSEVPAKHSKFNFFSQVARPLRCLSCVLSFPNIGAIRKHNLEVHSIDKSERCEMCNLTFISHTTYVNHLRGYHKLGKTFKCELCDYVAYANVKNLKQHMFTHTSQRTEECKYCHKKFKKNCNLELHERIHTREKMKKCPYCDQSFVQRTSLKYHCIKHHPGQPI